MNNELLIKKNAEHIDKIILILQNIDKSNENIWEIVKMLKTRVELLEEKLNETAN